MKYPQLRQELIDILAEDQSEIISFSRELSSLTTKQAKNREKDLKFNGYQRTQRVYQILQEIKEPSIDNVGLDGSQAISVIGLHAHFSVMQSILSVFEDTHKEGHSVHPEAIPSLTDRVRILKGEKQLFGTQWYQSKLGRPFLFPIEDFTQMNQLRAKYGLGLAMKPTNVATGSMPLGKGKAVSGDQKTPTKSEMLEYSALFDD